MKTAFIVAALACVLLSCGGAMAQDPATGWMAYARGKVPSGTERITSLEMMWTVGDNPESSFAFFSPWFGMDPADNLNLIQPVNPWFGSSWSYYTEYFQWSPENNSNSAQMPINAGDVLHGSLQYDASSDSYTLTQTNTNNGQSSSQVVQCQNGKKFVIPYVVYEKTFPCAYYPPDQNVTFHNIRVECDGKDCTQEMEWSAHVKDPNCDMTAHILSNTAISITWDTSASSRYDNLPTKVLAMINSGGWASEHAKKLVESLESLESL